MIETTYELEKRREYMRNYYKRPYARKKMRACQRIYQSRPKIKKYFKEYKLKNMKRIKEVIKIKKTKNMIANKRAAIVLMGGVCSYCGINAFDNKCHFHHVNPKLKAFSIGSHLDGSFEHIKQEISKCILLCAKCHMKLHAEMRRK